MSSSGLALGGCSCSTYFMLFAPATPRQPAEGEQAVPQPHPGVSGQLQDFWSVLGKSWWVAYKYILTGVVSCSRSSWGSLLSALLCCLQIGPSIPKEAFCSMLKDNKVLHSLSLHNCSDWVTDKELLPVIGQNQHLQRVDMSGCAWLTRHSLVAVSLSCMHLQSLGLAHCEWVDSLSLRSLADHCGGLQSIDLTACRQLKDDAICYLAKKCVKLRSLSLAVNANVTDESVEEVAKNCRGLEQLDLTGCLRVRNQSIRYIISYFQV